MSCYQQLGRWQTALETCEQGRLRFPDDAELSFRRATLLCQFGRLPEAARTCETLLAASGNRRLSSVAGSVKGYGTRQNLAAVYADMGDLGRAESQWRSVVETVPHHRAGWRDLGDVLVRQGRFDEALAVADRVGGNGAAGTDGLIVRSRVHMARGDAAAAQRELEQAACEAATDLEPLRALCQVFFGQGQPADAAQALEELLKRDPLDASAQHNLGSILYKLRDFGAAADAYRTSLELRPNSASTYVHLGYALREASQLNAAIAAWQKALRLARGDPAATAALHNAPSPSGAARFRSTTARHARGVVRLPRRCTSGFSLTSHLLNRHWVRLKPDVRGLRLNRRGAGVPVVPWCLVVHGIELKQTARLENRDPLAFSRAPDSRRGMYRVVAIMQANGLTNLASSDADFDRVAGVTRYAPA